MTRPAAVATVFLIGAGAACGADGPVAPTELPAAISLSAPDALEIGETITIKVTAVDAGGETLKPPQAVWSSDDPAVATVSSAGVVTGLTPGDVTVTAKAGELEASATIEVTPGEVTQLAIIAPPVLGSGYTTTFLAVGRNAWGKEIAAPPVTWASSNPGIAPVTPGGVVSGLGGGEVTIYALSGPLSATASLTITPVVSDVELGVLPQGEFGDTIVLAPGQSIQLGAYLYRLQWETHFNLAAAARWASSQPGVATVTSDGLVTAVALGTTEILASVDRLDAPRVIRVEPSPGTVRVRFINASSVQSPLVVRPNSGMPVEVSFGESSEVALPAGTLQVTVDGRPLRIPDLFDPSWIEVQQFTGYLPANTHTTIVLISNPGALFDFGWVNVVPLWDQTATLPADRVKVRVVLATGGGYNVYLTPPGAPMGTRFLQGCYLDWPYGVTDYAEQQAGTFDIVLEAKGRPGVEQTRHRVTPAPGKGMTYILTGEAAILNVMSFEDP